MRWYAIRIDGAPAVFPVVPGGSQYNAQWDSWVNGQNDPSAQQVEINFFTQKPSVPIADSSTLTIYGVSWAQVSSYADLIGLPITVYGGMHGPSFPLAEIQARNNGQIIQGRIQRCWGEWAGTDMFIGMTIVTAGNTPGGGGGGSGGGGGGSGGVGGEGGATATGSSMQMTRYSRAGPRSIDRFNMPVSQASGPGSLPVGFFLSGLESQLGLSDIGSAVSSIGGITSSFFGGGGGLANPLNFIHNMLPNMPLSSAIQETLSKVFPDANIIMRISSALKLGYQDAGIYQNMEQYATYIKNLSHSLLGTTNYQGVDMSSNDKNLIVHDGTIPGDPFTISAYELVGQPTWTNIREVSITVVMRAGIQVSDIIRLPPNIPYAVGPNAMINSVPQQKSRLTFSGTFMVQYIHYIGDFRNPDGRQWVTVYTCTINSIDIPPLTPEEQLAQFGNIDTTTNFAQLLADGIIPLSAVQSQSRLLRRPARKY